MFYPSRFSALWAGVCAFILLAGSRAQAQTISGFSSASYSLNGGATVANNVLTVTTDANNLARSAYYNTKVSYAGGFTTSFVYTPSGARAGDGFAFVLQNNGVTAVGGAGGGLGYSNIGTSAAVEFNIYSNNTIGMAFGTNGSIGPFAATGSVNLASGNPIQVTLGFVPSSSSLTVSLKDLTTSSTYSTSYSTNLSTVTGTTAFVGFSGGTGGATVKQDISNFTYTSTTNAPEPGSVALVTLGGVPALGLVYRRKRG